MKVVFSIIGILALFVIVVNMVMPSPPSYEARLHAAGLQCIRVTNLDYAATGVVVSCDDARHVYFVNDDGRISGD